MTKEQEQALEAIAAQQPKERSAVWMVGEQLKGMVRAAWEKAAAADRETGEKLGRAAMALTKKWSGEDWNA